MDPEESVEREQNLDYLYYRVGKDCVDFIIERVVTISTLIQLILLVGAVYNFLFRPAARALEAVAILLWAQQFKREYYIRMMLSRHRCPLCFHSASSNYQKFASEERLDFVIERTDRIWQSQYLQNPGWLSTYDERTK